MADYGMEKIVIYVDGMTCSHCEKAVQDALLSLDGVSEANADASVGVVDVTYDPESVTIEDMTLEIEETGYTVQDVREGSDQ